MLVEHHPPKKTSLTLGVPGTEQSCAVCEKVSPFSIHPIHVKFNSSQITSTTFPNKSNLYLEHPFNPLKHLSQHFFVVFNFVNFPPNPSFNWKTLLQWHKRATVLPIRPTSNCKSFDNLLYRKTSMAGPGKRGRPSKTDLPKGLGFRLLGIWVLFWRGKHILRILPPFSREKSHGFCWGF